MDTGVTDLRDHSQQCEHGHFLTCGFEDWCPGGRAVPIDDESDTEDVYQKEAWLPDVPGKGRYIWMIRSDVSASLQSKAADE